MRLPSRCGALFAAPSPTEHAAPIPSDVDHGAVAGQTSPREHSSTVGRSVVGLSMMEHHLDGLITPFRIARTAVLGVFLALGFVLVVLFGPAVAATPAFAAGTSSATCYATLNGVELSSASSPDNAIDLNADSTVAAAGRNVSVGTGSMHYQVEMMFYLVGERLGWTVASGDASGERYATTLNVAKYAKYGSGLYLLHVLSFGANGSHSCTIDGFINIKGGSLSDAGIAGVALAGAGILALAASGIVAGMEGRKLTPIDNVIAEEDAVTKAENEGQNEGQDAGGSSGGGDPETHLRESTSPGSFNFRYCGGLLLLAIPLTMATVLWELARNAVHSVRGMT